MLTGILPPSTGLVRIQGLDLYDEMNEIRKITGVCPQFDILWYDYRLWIFLCTIYLILVRDWKSNRISEQLSYKISLSLNIVNMISFGCLSCFLFSARDALTAYEHVELFAGLRGVPPEGVADEARTRLEEVFFQSLPCLLFSRRL